MEEVTGFAVDSRKVEPGFAFFALKGEKVDGHDFLQEARFRGASCAVVSKDYPIKIPGLKLIYKENVLGFLQDLAKKELRQRKARCIAVTGSVGKTTTKEFMATLLSESFVVGKTPGNANSQIGLPLSILNEKKKTQVFIAEMGMTGKGQISSLVSIVSPEFVVVTHIGLAHSLYFPSGLEEIAQAKAEILQDPNTKKAFIHVQARPFSAFSQMRNCETVFYGQGSTCEILKEDKLWKIVCQNESSQPFALPFLGAHLRDNFLAAALVARQMGVSFEQIANRASLLTPHAMRFQILEKRGVTYVNDAYNANPSSVKAALENIPKPKPGAKTIAVLGEMKELGLFSKKAHEEIGELACKQADVLLCLGEECLVMADVFRKGGKNAEHFSSLPELKKCLDFLAQEGDVVLIKASNSLKMWTILEEEKDE